MMTERKTLKIFIILIITATFNLIYSGIGHAALTINGPGQMPVGATQNYTATGGSGSYSGWGISGGVGSFSGSGDSVFFTAPNITSNTNCNANPTICVIDSEGSIACKKIAVNC